MISIIFPASAFLCGLLGGLRSLGLGVLLVIGFGYVNGYVRANYLGIFSTFMFDAGVLGLYIAALQRGVFQTKTVWNSQVGRFLVFLIAWPCFMALLPINDLLIQMVALRSVIWFLPVIVIGINLSDKDLEVLCRGMAILNFLALLIGIYLYFRGIETLFPRNAVTEIMYLSRDVAGGHYRIPASFLSAHAYGGTMAATIPLFLGRLLGEKLTVDKLFASVGVVCAIGGILLCGARLPVVIVALTVGCSFYFIKLSPARLMLVIVLILGTVYTVASNERFQRLESLSETDVVEQRVNISINQNFLDLLVGYPLGAGMGSAVGTSIPFFLADRAPTPIGMENEYSRMLVDQGIPGLLIWISFLIWLLSTSPRVSSGHPWYFSLILMYCFCVVIWGTAWIGTGMLTSIPQSVILLTFMGIIARYRDPSLRQTPKDKMVMDLEKIVSRSMRMARKMDHPVGRTK